jgi:hypothetical protein
MAENQTEPGEVKTVKVLFGIPKDGKTEPRAYDNRMEMCFRLGALQIASQLGLKEVCGIKFNYPDNVKFEFFIATQGRVFTALSRERIADTAVSMGADYLLMVDDDMIVPSDLFEQLYRHNVDIVAPLAFTRYPPHKPVLYELKRGFDVIKNQEHYTNYPILDYPKDTLVECDAVGFGSVLIKVDVLKSIPKSWFMNTSPAGEDIHFCWSAIKNGRKVFMDTSIKIGHLSDPEEITEETYESEKNKTALKGEYGTA